MKPPERKRLDYGSLLWIGVHIMILAMICIPAFFLGIVAYGGGIFGFLFMTGIVVWGYFDAFKKKK